MNKSETNERIKTEKEDRKRDKDKENRICHHF